MDNSKNARLAREHRQLINKSASETKQCYFIGCDKPTIHAHSISNERLVRKLSDNGKVLSTGKDMQGQDFSELAEVGRGKATTFGGFCEEHDKIFQPIDNTDYEVGNLEQQFLFAMRASAKEFNVRQTVSQSIEARLDKNQDFEFKLDEEGTEMMKLLKLGYGVGDKDLKENRGIFVDTFIKSKYNVIQTDIIVADDELPIAVSSSFHLELAPDGSLINDVSPSGWDTKMQSWFLTVFPQNGKTYCLISYFRKYRNTFRFLDDIAKAGNAQKQVVISNLITSYTENFVANPTYWNSLSDETKAKYDAVFANSFKTEHAPFMADDTLNLFPTE